MTNKNISSPLHRAKSVVEAWFELMPKDSRMDAQMALDRLVQTAESQIEQAHSDGYQFYLACRRVHEAMSAASNVGALRP